MEKSASKGSRCQHLFGRHTRRDFFGLVADGIYGAALADLLCRDLYGSTGQLTAQAASGLDLGHRAVYDLKPRPPHFEPKAKAVIQLLMNGAPSHMDLFDPKPKLQELAGTSPGDLLQSGAEREIEAAAETLGFLPSPFKFAQYGKSGMWMSEVMPHLSEVADEIAMIRSMHTPSPFHNIALHFLQSGKASIAASLGAWTIYGLGTMNQNLPAFVVLDDPAGLPTEGVINWTGGDLPPIYQGTRMNSWGAPAFDLRPEVEDPPEMVKLGRGLLSQLDRIHEQERPGQPMLDTRIATYELAARLQLEATSALDISQESKETLEMYGVGQKASCQGLIYKNPGPDSYARRAIMARRLVERGVRFVQICLNSAIWDQHSALEKDIRANCDRTDKPVAALLKDLKQRGMLDSTLVIWGGEFGRLPFGQNHEGGGPDNPQSLAGRDHNGKAFTVWMAGGGVKGGSVYGATDELGFQAVENPVGVYDLHATILHCLGLDYKKLYYEVDGTKERLTGDAEARVVKEILV